MDVHDITFSVNEYDSDGDITEEGIFLHFSESRIKVSENIDDFNLFIRHLEKIEKEIIELLSYD